MKFIHTADVHWGMNPDSDRPWSRERAQAIRDSFAEVIRQARIVKILTLTMLSCAISLGDF